jgi:hypothetical protein
VSSNLLKVSVHETVKSGTEPAPGRLSGLFIHNHPFKCDAQRRRTELAAHTHTHDSPDNCQSALRGTRARPTARLRSHSTRRVPGGEPRHCRSAAPMPYKEDRPRTSYMPHNSTHPAPTQVIPAALQRCSSGLQVLTHAATRTRRHQTWLRFRRTGLMFRHTWLRFRQTWLWFRQTWLRFGRRSRINPPRMATSSVAASIGGPNGSSTRLSPRLMIARARQK